MKIIILAIVFLAIGAMMSATVSSSLNGWYAALNKPFLNPPDFIFAPIWSILYISLAVFIWMIDRQPYTPLTRKAKQIFIWQLILNFLWTPVFFGLQNIAGGLIILLIIDFLVFRLVRLSFKIDRTCAFIIIPYFCWLLFATYLNISFFVIN